MKRSQRSLRISGVGAYAQDRPEVTPRDRVGIS
jgi:hypothetical protein